jgi:cytochrome c oxidase cbb3-type subunit 1
VESVEAMHPYYIIRAIGGVLYLIGALLMAYNLWRTARGDAPEAVTVPSNAAPAAVAAE